MKPRDYVLAQIHHQETKPVPYSLDFEPVVAERLDEHYGGPQWRQRMVPYIVRFSAVDNVLWEPLDETRVRDAYGGTWRIDRRPWHHEQGPLAEPTLEGYTYPPAERFINPGPRVEMYGYGPPLTREQALQKCADNQDSFLIAHAGWGIWETAWQMRGFQNALMDAVAEPDFFAQMLDQHTEMALTYVDYAATLPVDAIMFGEDWGIQTGIMLGPKTWRKLLKPRWAKIYERIHRHGKLAINHCCGSVAEVLPDIVEIGLDVLESVQPEAKGNDPYQFKRQFGDKITFWGGLGSQSLIPFGTPDEIRAEVARICAEMGKGGGYILAPAKTLQPETPTENAVAVLETFAGQG